VVEQGTHKPPDLSAVLPRVGTDRKCAQLCALSAANVRAHNSDRAHTYFRLVEVLNSIRQPTLIVYAPWDRWPHAELARPLPSRGQLRADSPGIPLSHPVGASFRTFLDEPLASGVNRRMPFASSGSIARRSSIAVGTCIEAGLTRASLTPIPGLLRWQRGCPITSGRA
jgi:hypothetical protein